MSRSVNQRGGHPPLTVYVSERVPKEAENSATGQKVLCEEDPDNDGCYVACGIKSNGDEYDLFLSPDYRKTGGWAVQVQRQSDGSFYTPSEKTLTVVRRFKIKPKVAVGARTEPAKSS